MSDSDDEGTLVGCSSWAASIGRAYLVPDPVKVRVSTEADAAAGWGGKTCLPLLVGLPRW